jgi:hypothetical protein
MGKYKWFCEQFEKINQRQGQGVGTPVYSCQSELQASYWFKIGRGRLKSLGDWAPTLW